MNPSHVMGLFIRVWREQWAGLTRAQLALAVSAAAEPPTGVGPHIVAAWESGQPPKTAAELMALLQVMRRHGLSEQELAEVRAVALAACGGRQYAELFPEETLCDPQSLSATAADLYQRRMRPPQRGPLPQLLALTAAVGELVRGGEPGTSEHRTQTVALCQLLSTVSHHHWYYGRRGLQAAAAGACAAALYEHFGLGGLAEGLTPLLLWSVQAHALAHVPGPQALGEAARLRELHQRALAACRQSEAALIFCQMADAAGELEPGAYSVLAASGLRSQELLPDPSDLPNRLAWAAAAEGRVDEAELHLGDWAALARHERCPHHQALVRGWLALGRADHAEAADCFSFAVSEAQRLSFPSAIAAEYLGLCRHAAAARVALSYRQYRLGQVPRAWRGER